MGSRNHQLEIISTPLQLFAQLIFWVLQPFSTQDYCFTSPTRRASFSPATQASPKQQKRLKGLLAALLVFVAF